MRTLLLACSCLLALTPAARAQDEHTPEQYQAARDFSVDGIKLGMTADQVRTLGYPLSERDAEDDVKGGAASWDVIGPPDFDDVAVLIFRDSIYTITFSYRDDRLQKKGGARAIHEEITKKFGPMKSETKYHSAIWTFPDLKRDMLMMEPICGMPLCIIWSDHTFDLEIVPKGLGSAMPVQDSPSPVQVGNEKKINAPPKHPAPPPPSP
jgi:hypothetical protein